MNQVLNTHTHSNNCPKSVWRRGEGERLYPSGKKMNECAVAKLVLYNSFKIFNNIKYKTGYLCKILGLIKLWRALKYACCERLFVLHDRRSFANKRFPSKREKMIFKMILKLRFFFLNGKFSAAKLFILRSVVWDTNEFNYWHFFIFPKINDYEHPAAPAPYKNGNSWNIHTHNKCGKFRKNIIMLWIQSKTACPSTLKQKIFVYSFAYSSRRRACWDPPPAILPV